MSLEHYTSNYFHSDYSEADIQEFLNIVHQTYQVEIRTRKPREFVPPSQPIPVKLNLEDFDIQSRFNFDNFNGYDLSEFNTESKLPDISSSSAPCNYSDGRVYLNNGVMLQYNGDVAGLRKAIRNRNTKLNLSLHKKDTSRAQPKADGDEDFIFSMEL